MALAVVLGVGGEVGDLDRELAGLRVVARDVERVGVGREGLVGVGAVGGAVDLDGVVAQHRDELVLGRDVRISRLLLALNIYHNRNAVLRRLPASTVMDELDAVGFILINKRVAGGCIVVLVNIGVNVLDGHNNISVIIVGIAD